MNIKTYENCAVYVDDYFILGRSLTISSANSLLPQFTVDHRFRNSSYVPQDGIRHGLSLTYYPLGYDAINALVTQDRPAKFQVGDMTFEAYLSSLSVSAEYAQPLTVDATFDCFKDFNGELGDERISHSELSVFGNNKIKIPNTLVTSVTNTMSVVIPLRASYSYSTEWKPVYRIGSSTVDEVRYGKKKKSASLDGENIGRYINVNGSDGTISIRPKDLCNGELDQLIYRYYSNYDIEAALRNSVYECAGKIIRFDTKIDEGPIVVGTIEIESWL